MHGQSSMNLSALVSVVVMVTTADTTDDSDVVRMGVMAGKLSSD